MGLERYDEAFLAEREDAAAAECPRHRRRGAGGPRHEALRLASAVLLLAACGGEPATAVFQGYVEGEFVEVAPEVGGRIVELAVRRGDAVDGRRAALPHRRRGGEGRGRAGARPNWRAPRRSSPISLQGQRPPEIAVIEAQIAEARGLAATQARKDFERQRQLFERGVISEARLDQAREAVSVAEARVAAAERQRDVAEMPARTPEIDAARARRRGRARRARAGGDAARANMSSPRRSPAASRTSTTSGRGRLRRRAGPVAAARRTGRKVDLLRARGGAAGAHDRRRTSRSPATAARPGSRPRSTFLGREAEFTPPVIFSRDTREKLVFRAEARLPARRRALPLGQPVDVAPALRGAE